MDRAREDVWIHVASKRANHRLFLSARGYGFEISGSTDEIRGDRGRKRIRSMVPLPRRKPLLSAPRLDGVARAVPCVPITITIVIVVACHLPKRQTAACVTAFCSDSRFVSFRLDPRPKLEARFEFHQVRKFCPVCLAVLDAASRVLSRPASRR